ncbi:MAG: DegV family protein, partial [Eubacteriales bacterium]|nr:DegV family protein [Eubacteriales bacterium]
MIRIITDSAADFEPHELKENNIYCVPMQISFNDVEYKENENLSKEQFYELLQITDKPTIFRWVFVIHIKFLIFVDKKCKSLLQRIFAIFFMFCTAAVS